MVEFFLGGENTRDVIIAGFDVYINRLELMGGLGTNFYSTFLNYGCGGALIMLKSVDNSQPMEWNRDWQKFNEFVITLDYRFITI